MYGICSGSKPISDAPTVSAATGSSAKTKTPDPMGSPEIGPLPSIPTIPSMIA